MLLTTLTLTLTNPDDASGGHLIGKWWIIDCPKDISSMFWAMHMWF